MQGHEEVQIRLFLLFLSYSCPFVNNCLLAVLPVYWLLTRLQRTPQT
jgi:hypothetical protein